MRCLRLRVDGREIIVDWGHQAMTARGQRLLCLESALPRTTVLCLADRGREPVKAGDLARELAEAHVDLGEQLIQAGHPVDARKELERALVFDPEHRGALLGLARVFEALGCPVKAEEYRKSSRREP